MEERKRSKPFQKCLSENEATFEFEKLIPKPYQRDHKPFQKSLDRKPLLNLKRHEGVINRRNGCGTSLFKKLLDRNPFQKSLDRKPEKYLSLRILSPNPIGVINRRNGCGSTVAGQRLRVNGCGSTVDRKERVLASSFTFHSLL